MTTEEKREYSALKKDRCFQLLLNKLILNKELSNAEQSYLLTAAIIFSKQYQNDKRYKTFIELAYYIILKFSLSYKNFEPLFDFSLNFGFFPIAKTIINFNLNPTLSLNGYLHSVKLNKYYHKNYYETYQQNKSRISLLKNNFKEISLIAPTSYGKSGIIEDYLLNFNSSYSKIVVIVPTKSLLRQTQNMIKSLKLEKKIIVHDEMYNGEEEFIAILTQERAFRLMNNKKVIFDLLFIDEAHNLFSNDSRTILLARVIKKANLINKKLKTIYLSPLISDINNIKLNENQPISEQRVSFNIKEPELYEYALDGTSYKYNRFLDEFLPMKSYHNFIDYIIENSSHKNFIYIRSPKKIEKFAFELSNELEEIEITSEIEEIINTLSDYIHKDFYQVTLLKKGIIYLHGKLPASIKEYLESKYKKIPSLKYIIANDVILEGINLPITSLFILYTHKLSKNSLINLIGRVNRLNIIFSKEENNLSLLLPQVFFVNHQLYNSTRGNMKNKIRELRSYEVSDKVSNPLLFNFLLDKKASNSVVNKVKKIIDEEIFLENPSTTFQEKIKAYLIKENIREFYNDLNLAAADLASAFKKSISQERLIDKIFSCFLTNTDNICDYEIRRLQRIEARNFYNYHIEISNSLPLKDVILKTFNYFSNKKERPDSLLFIGHSYGEISYNSNAYTNPQNVYVNLAEKSNKEIANLAIIKVELENKFVDYKLNKLITMLYDFGLIQEREYNIHIYGTDDSYSIKMLKLGLTPNLLKFLNENNQLKNIKINPNNTLEVNQEFRTFLSSIDDFTRFTIERLI